MPLRITSFPSFSAAAALAGPVPLLQGLAAHPWVLLALLLALAAAAAVVLRVVLRARERDCAARLDSARQAGEARFRELLDRAPIPVAVGRIGDGRILYTNATLSQALGLPRDGLTSRASFEFWAREEDRLEVLEILAREGHVRNLERPFRCPGGKPLWAIFSASVLPFGEGPAIYMAFADITDHKRTEEALRASEARWRSLFEGAPIPISLAKDGRFLYVNPAYLRMMGFDAAEELVGRPVMDLIAPEARPILQARDECRRRGEPLPSRYECIGLRKDATPFPYAISVGTVPMEAGPVTLAFLEDITDRKRVEEALRASESRFREIANDLPVAMATVTPEGQIEFLNRRFTQLFGYQLEDIPTTDDWYRLAYPEPSARSAILEVGTSMMAEARLFRRPSGPVEFPVRCRDGSIKDAEFHYVDLQDRGLWTLQDLTERNRIQESLRQALKMESLGLMAGGIAHDFNNLLQGILGNLEMASHLLHDPERARGALERAQLALGTASELSSRMLDFSGRTFLNLRPVDLRILLREARPGLEALAARHPGARLVWDLSADIPSAFGDPGRLGQVVEILVSNALEALPEGGGAVHIGLRPPQRGVAALPGFWMEPAPEDVGVCLSVSDEGAGIAPKDLERIFDPFVTTKDPGRGLGLSAALGILRAHKAGLQIQSGPGEGTVFRIFLRAAGALELPDAPDGPRPTAPAPEAPRAVLVADDEDILRETMAEYLRDILGYPVYEARDGQEALEIYKAHSDEIALVLMDATMPRMKGGEAFDAIRALRPDIRGFLCSGFSEDMGREAVTRHGFSGFLKKPFTLAQLEALVRQVLHPAPEPPAMLVRPPDGPP